MREIGGYLELDTYRLPMLHEQAIALNSGRNCLAYLIQKKNIKKIYIPKLLCASVGNVCRRENVEIIYYSVGLDFHPINIDADENDWVYIVNYYGQIPNDALREYKKKYNNLIVDNIQAYFQEPVSEIDTIYTCRKFLGVTDGAFLYSDIEEDSDLEIDKSYGRMTFLLGRYEEAASEFYSDYASSEEEFERMPVRKMSKLTNNLLHGIDYKYIEDRRTGNFMFLHEKLKKVNKLQLNIPKGPYMYPFLIEGGMSVRKKLQAQKIYIATLWPDVFDLCKQTDLEYNMANNILPLPVDQRYGSEDMEYLTEKIKNIIECHDG